MNTGSRRYSAWPSNNVPPPIEKNQNATGITLLRARSEAIHCTTKRMVKNPCATNPRMTQPSNLITKTSCRYPAKALNSSVMRRHLGSCGCRLLAADQPPYACQIHDSDPQPVEEAIIRHAGMAGPVDDVDIGDVVSLAPHQRRQKAVQPVEIGHCQKHLAPERLEAAAGIAGPIAEHRVAHAIG